MNKVEKMEKINKKLVNLKKSPLYNYRVKNNFKSVIGEGNINSKIIFIGEAPGKKEAETGKPFCGASGKMLDKLLRSIKLEREDIYITNIVKDRPQDNRDPSLEEIKLYGKILNEQIKIIQPKIIVTLGRFSMEYIMKKFGIEKEIEPISKAHGKKFEAKSSYGELKIIPLYHPAVALYNGGMKETLLKDFKKVLKY